MAVTQFTQTEPLPRILYRFRARWAAPACARKSGEFPHFFPISLVCMLWSLAGCNTAPPGTASFEVHPTADGSAVVWALDFQTRDQYHRFIDTAPDGQERDKVRELIAAGLALHHLAGCAAREQAVTRISPDGIAFIGTCPVAARAVLARGT
jgi:hypothetical protein